MDTTRARTHTVNGTTNANYWVRWGCSAHHNVYSADALTVWAKSSLKFLIFLLFLPVQIQFPTQTRPCCYETVTMNLKNQVIGETIAEVEHTRTASVLGLGLVAPRANTWDTTFVFNFLQERSLDVRSVPLHSSLLFILVPRSVVSLHLFVNCAILCWFWFATSVHVFSCCSVYVGFSGLSILQVWMNVAFLLSEATPRNG